MKLPPIRLAVLISGSGTTLQNFIDEIATGRLNAKIVQVIASRPGITGIDRAHKAGLDCQTIDRKSFPDTAAFSDKIFSQIQSSSADLVCLAGWLSLLKIPARWTGRVMNIHPALLPDFGGPGMYGARVHQAVLAAHSKISGCTVHFVDDHYDAGPIILQRVCPVMEDDTPETLAHRIFEEEKKAYPQAIRLHQENRLRIDGRTVRVLPQK